MSKNNKVYAGKIPFTWVDRFEYSDGTVREAYRRQLDYEIYKVDNWLDNTQFIATLKFLSMSRGRSAANFEGVLQELRGGEYNLRAFLEGCHVNIFMTDMLDIVRKTDIFHGRTLPAVWTFCKRGNNYGLRWVENAS